MLKKRSNDYKQFHFNEIRPGICEFIKDAISGKYNYDCFKPKFITREEFLEKKDKCAYTKIIWSFGNDGKTYLFGKSIESYKESMHNAIIFNKFNNEAREFLGIKQFFEWQSVKDRRLFLSSVAISRSKIKKLDPDKLKQPQHLAQLQQLERLQQLEQLQQHQQLERLQFTNKDYREVKIKPNSIVYCDIPYVGTGSYDNKEFNHQDFYDWAHNLKEPVFISEYNVRVPRFKIVFKIKRRSMFGSNSNARVVKEERVYGNKAAIKLLISSNL